MPLTELLYSFRQQSIGPKDIGVLMKTMNEHKLDKVPLWRMSSLVKLAVGTARWQSYLIIYFGLLFVPPAVYEKYTENPEKLVRLSIYSPIALTFILAPFIFYRRASKRMLTAIDYHQPTNSFQLMTYKNKLLKIPVEQLKVVNNPSKPKIVH